MSKPPEPFEDRDPHPYDDSPYAAGAPRDRAPYPPPFPPYGQPGQQWAPPPYGQDAYGNDQYQPQWGQPGENAGYPPSPQQPWSSYPSHPPQAYPPPGYRGDMSQSPYFESSDVQPWTIPASGPMLSSRSWPDISLDTLSPLALMQSPLARPLPRWVLVLACVVTVGLLVVAALSGKDWAAGALHAGLAAGALAVLVLLITLVRSIGGMAARTNEQRQVQYTGAVLVMVILLVFSGIGIGLQAPIRHVQAGTLANSQQWQSAINELRLAGETAPTSEALAQVYDEWGEHLSSTQHYDEAISKFAFVIASFSAAPQGLHRAQTDALSAYIAWGQQAALMKDYKGATQHFDAALKQYYCLTDCHTRVNVLDAAAYYNLAETSLSAHDYATAASAFGALATRFADAAEMQKIHGDYATALLGWGKQQLAGGTCTDAVPTYQKLANDFADTDPGQLATVALQAPQPVMGQLTAANPSLKIQAILATNLIVDTSGHAPTIASFVTVATTPLDSSGAFHFAPVAQGHYPLLWQFSANGKLQTLTFISTDGSNAPAIVANVGPLCPFDFGAITEPLGA